MAAFSPEARNGQRLENVVFCECLRSHAFSWWNVMPFHWPATWNVVFCMPSTLTPTWDLEMTVFAFPCVFVMKCDAFSVSPFACVFTGLRLGNMVFCVSPTLTLTWALEISCVSVMKWDAFSVSVFACVLVMKIKTCSPSSILVVSSLTCTRLYLRLGYCYYTCLQP